MKVLFSSYPNDGHIAWFDPRTNKLEPHCITKQTAPHESTVHFPKSGHTTWFDPQTKTLEPHCITKQTAPHERTVAFQRIVSTRSPSVQCQDVKIYII